MTSPQPNSDLQAAEAICSGKNASTPRLAHLQAVISDRDKWRARAMELQREAKADRYDLPFDDEPEERADAIFLVERVH